MTSSRFFLLFLSFLVLGCNAPADEGQMPEAPASTLVPRVDAPPTWSEVLEVAAEYLAETGGMPLRVDPDPEGMEFTLTRPTSEEIERRRLRLRSLGLTEISYDWVAGCYASFTLPPGDKPPFVDPKCLPVPRDGSVVGFDDPVRDESGWSAEVGLINRDVIMAVKIHLEKKDQTWIATGFDRKLIYNY